MSSQTSPSPSPFPPIKPDKIVLYLSKLSNATCTSQPSQVFDRKDPDGDEYEPDNVPPFGGSILKRVQSGTNWTYELTLTVADGECCSGGPFTFKRTMVEDSPVGTYAQDDGGTSSINFGKAEAS